MGGLHGPRETERLSARENAAATRTRNGRPPLAPDRLARRLGIRAQHEGPCNSLRLSRTGQAAQWSNEAKVATTLGRVENAGALCRPAAAGYTARRMWLAIRRIIRGRKGDRFRQLARSRSHWEMTSGDPANCPRRFVLHISNGRGILALLQRADDVGSVLIR